MAVQLDDIRASWQSQLLGRTCEIGDSRELVRLREAAKDYEGMIALGDGLSRQLRYREAAEAYSAALDCRPGDIKALRLRAGRYLSTLRCSLAKEDFLLCHERCGLTVDVSYRLGLCCYFEADFEGAAGWFELCYPLCGDEMAVAAIYWHTICCLRLGKAPRLIKHYRAEMNVGHHTAYKAAVSVFAGQAGLEDMLAQLAAETDDMEYAIVLYGICSILLSEGRHEDYALYMDLLIKRDGFWPCYAYLAAWLDQRA